VTRNSGPAGDALQPGVEPVEGGEDLVVAGPVGEVAAE
jgi:hypothetical protein